MMLRTDVLLDISHWKYHCNDVLANFVGRF